MAHASVLSVGSFNTSEPAASTAAVDATLSAFSSGSAVVRTGMMHNKVQSIPRWVGYNFHQRTGPDVELKSELWSKLPADLVEEVMRRLPFAALWKFRIVSKQWHKMLTLKKDDLYLLEIRRCEDLKYSRVYDCTSKQWSFIDVSFLHEKVLRRLITRLVKWAGPGFRPLTKYWWHILQTCADGGLLCVWAVLVIVRNCFGETPDTHIIHQHCLLVCNPLTGRYKVLLRMLPMEISKRRMEVLNLSMQRDSATGEYIIFSVLLECGSPLETYNMVKFFKYESTSDSSTPLYSHPKSKDGFLYCGAIFKDVFCFVMGKEDLEIGDDGSEEQRCGLLFAYDIKRGRIIFSAHRVKTDPYASEWSFVVHNNRLRLLSSFDVEHFNARMIVCSSHNVAILFRSPGTEEDDPHHSDVDVILGRPEILAVMIPAPSGDGKWEQWTFFTDGDSIFFATHSTRTYEVGISCVSSADLEATTRAARFVWRDGDSFLYRRRSMRMDLTKIKLDMGVAV